MMSLTVLPNTTPPAALSESERAKLAAELEGLLPGRVHFDAHHRMLYSTDASIYQIEPLGVVMPGSIGDLLRLTQHCGQRGIALLPRGGGTSLAGQCTNRAVVVDYSGSCRGVLSLGAAERTCHVEPGITVDELNRWLEAENCGLFFAPDPATAAQASIGGCIGNNAAGAHSIRYGRTSENVAALDVALVTGQRLWLGPGAGRGDPAARDLAQRVAQVVQQYAALIRERFPKTTRRNAGYALDLILAQLDRGITPEDMDLTGLLCGSEGTLAVTLSARLKLHPIPRYKGLAILSFASVAEAISAVAACVGTGACAVELLDDVVLEAARGNTECCRYMDLLSEVNGAAPQAVLYVEYQETGGMDEVRARFDLLRRALPGAAVGTYIDTPSLSRAWALRKAGEPLLHALAGHRKPVTGVEDNAVPLENLVRFVDGFKQIVTRHGTKAAYYAHASVGVLHVRPLLDLHDPADRDRLRAIAVEVADLARDCGGIMSGEHGDGRIRAPLLERYFGAELMQAFREIKRIFDPAGILNPGHIVAPGPIQSITESLRINPAGPELPWPTVETWFDYSDQEGFSGAVERCNGAGVCRKTAGGTMCPSYRATMDERHSTRGRGNALRLAISGQLPAGNSPGQAAWGDPETLETLSLCLSCKACKTECPSNVDVARLKAEYTAQTYRHLGHVPLQARVFGHVRRLNRLGSIVPGLANWFNALSSVRAIANRLLGLAPQRTLPPFAPSLYRWFASHPRPQTDLAAPRVALFADCFITYNEPAIGKAAVSILESLGYAVDLPKVGCCGRSMISTGLLDDAVRSADAVLAQLRPFIDDPQVKAIIVCEPSCLSAMKDDWLQLRLKTDMALRKRLAAKATMPEDFIERFWEKHPRQPRIAAESPPLSRPVLLHGHCHQKALWGDDTSSRILRRLLGDRLKVLPSGCCGMAGGFGYTKDRYDVSMKIGEQSLFSLVREADADSLLLAPGTSCRHQIKDGLARPALHPIELLAQLLIPSSKSDASSG